MDLFCGGMAVGIYDYFLKTSKNPGINPYQLIEILNQSPHDFSFLIFANCLMQQYELLYGLDANKFSWVVGSNKLLSFSRFNSSQYLKKSSSNP
jgi:hypothetical protein